MMDDWTTYAGRLNWAMHQAGKTNQSELARAVGVKPQSIQYLCRRGAGAQGSKHTAALAQALNVSPRWLARNEGLPDAEIWQVESGDDAGYALPSDGRTRVTGTFRVHDDGEIEIIDLPQGESDGFIQTPLRMAGLAAVRVKGNALAPYAKDGQYLLLQRQGILYPEENLVIFLKDGRTLVRELMHRKPSTMVVLPIHGGKPLALELEDIGEAVPIICVVPQSRWRPDQPDRPGLLAGKT